MSQQPASESVLLPAQERVIDLGFADIEYNPRSLALDAAANRLYVSLSPTRTVVLNAESLTVLNEIPVGGALSVDPQLKRLFVGTTGREQYHETLANLLVFDTTNFHLLQSVMLSGTSSLPPLVDIDPYHNTAYFTQERITIADATTLEVQGTLDEQLAPPDAPGPKDTAVDAALDPEWQRLWVSVSNNIPGTNYGIFLHVYDLTSGQTINHDVERSVQSLAVDSQTGQAMVVYAGGTGLAIVKYDSQGNPLKRVEAVNGRVQIDPQHDRVYVLESNDRQRLKVLDRDLNFLGVIDLPIDVAPKGFLLDAERDRLFILQNDGRLLVFKGHGQPIGQSTRVSPEQRQAVQWIVPDLSDRTDQTLFAAFGSDEYNTGHGTLYHSGDTGSTWQLASSFPVDAVSDLKFAGHEIFAAVGNPESPNGYGVWRSEDDGQSWLPSAHGLTDLGITRLAISPDFARDDTLFALSSRGVFRSTDRGTTWVPLADRYAPLLKDLTVTFHAIALSPNFAQDNTLLISHSSGLWRSTDRGETWASVTGSPAANRLAVAPDGSIVLAIDYEGVHRSIDGGQTWRLFNDGLDPSHITIGDVQINDREAEILVTSLGQHGEVYRLPLNETTWQRMPIDADVSALALTTDGRLFLGTKTGGVQRVK